MGAQDIANKSVEPGATVIGLNKALSKNGTKRSKGTKQKRENETTWWAETREAGGYYDNRPEATHRCLYEQCQ